MAVTVNVQNNPNRANVGTEASKATIITSGFTDGTVVYHIQKMLDPSVTLVVSSNHSLSQHVLAVSSSELQIVLQARTRYRVRARRGLGAWTAWVVFKTRDTSYATPCAASYLSDDNDNNAEETGSVTINVTNSAKATIVNTSEGATVTNTDTLYNSVTTVTATAEGATIEHSD